jgi:hypothetical protein
VAVPRPSQAIRETASKLDTGGSDEKTVCVGVRLVNPVWIPP